MIKKIKTIKKLNAEIAVPGSKSYTNRALIVSALAGGRTIIEKPSLCDDVNYMVNALNKLGVKVIKKRGCLEVYGAGGKLKVQEKKLYLGNAGTTMRFLTAFAALANGKIILTGNKRMKERPIQDLVDGINKLGANAKTDNGYPPVTIEGKNLTGGKIELNGDKSSQFLSSILMAAPYAKNDVKIEVINLTSKPYVDMTLNVMKEFGVKVINNNYKMFLVKNNQKYKAKRYIVEGDASSASYFFASAAITKGKVKVKNINPKLMQGDIYFADILKKMGCRIKKGKDFIEVQGSDLRGVNIDMNQTPDIVQTLGVVAAFAKTNTKITNVANLRIKETDRIEALATELRKIGAKVCELKDGLLIKPDKLHGAEIKTYNDHRMAMSFAIAGLKIDGIKIKNPECVNKSFPEFWDKLEEFYL